VVLATAAPILTGTSLLIRPAAIALPSVAVRRWSGVALPAVLSGTTVAAGAPVAA
jgi:hypothetical protein